MAMKKSDIQRSAAPSNRKKKLFFTQKNAAAIHESIFSSTLALYMALFWLAVLIPGSVFAIGNFHPSPEELKLLPKYCTPRAYHWGNNRKDPRTRKWYKIFGDQYTRMHHYCQAMLNLRKAMLEFNPGSRKGLCAQAKNDLEYMEKGIPSDFVLLPELYVMFSQTYQCLGNPGSAFAYAEKAVRLRPDYVKGAITYADLAVKLGQREAARRVLETALKKKPRSHRLLRRMTCLKGHGQEDCPPGYNKESAE